MPNNNNYITGAPAEQRVNGHAVLHNNRQSPYELRSEEVQDIMTKMPSWFIRQGTTVLFTVIILLVAGAYFIHFPDVVTAQVNIRPVYPASTHTKSEESVNYETTAILPLEMASKVKPGQQVLVKLHLYPYQQFGIVEGKVETILAGNTDTSYIVTIRLMKGLVTSTNKKINAGTQLSGIAEVLTSDKTILQRLFETINAN